MKQWGAGVTVLVTAALCATAMGWDGSSSLRGNVDSGGRVAIEIDEDRFRDGTRTERYRWKFSHLSVRCDGRERLARHEVTGGFEISARYGGPGPWGLSGTSAGDPRDPSYETKVKGRLITYRKAKGWVRVSGNAVPLRGGGSAECDSGRLRWVARD
jgi:hypothetical protein